MSEIEQTIVVVDDDEAMRDSILWLLESLLLPIHAYGGGHDFLAALPNLNSGCILLDVRMPEMSGMDVLFELKNRDIAHPVIMITGHGDVPMAVRAIKSGAFDFVQKPFNPQELMGKVIAALDLDKQRRKVALQFELQRSLYASLTERETEVAELMVRGNSSKLIAAHLGISPKTVDIHRANVMKKLNVRTVAEIVQMKLFFVEDDHR